MKRVLVIGGGHNGLICALHLAHQGRDVTVLEANGSLGGACAPDHMSCGCLLYSGANHFGMMPPDVTDLLRRQRINLQFIRPSAQVMSVADVERPLLLSDSIDETVHSISSVSVADAASAADFFNDVAAAAALLNEQRSDPNLGIMEYRARVSELGANAVEDFIDGSISKTLHKYFKEPIVQGLFASSMILFNAPPARSGTALALPYYSMMQVDGRPGWAMLVGGMESLISGLEARLLNSGVTIRTGSVVSKLSVSSGRVVSATLSTGEEVEADVFVSACDPFKTGRFLRSGGYTSFAWRKLQSIWRRTSFLGMCGKATFLLRSLPRIRGFDDSLNSIASRTMITNLRSLGMMEKAYKSSVANFISTEPYLEVLLPSMIDSTQSCGRHITASVFFMYSKFSKSGEEALKGVAAQRVLAALRGIYENFDECVDYMDIKTSNGLSNRFGFTFGNVDHGSLVPDYSLNSRGLPGYRPPTTDLDNLFLASAGAMPGGLVSGVPGVIAAKAIGALS